MARPERNTVDYFPHLLGEGKKMYFIENKYGNNGYAVWYKILEKLGSTEYHYLNLNKEEEVMFLASKCKVSEDVLILIINDLSKMDVFHKELWANKIIWCPQFMQSIEDAYKKRNNKCITLDGLRILLDGLGILKLGKSTSKGHGNTQRIGEDSKLDERKEEETKLSFDLFWNLYPHKIGKAKCEPKWDKLKLEQQEKILATLPNFIKYKPFESYTHPNPETYLNQERWEDVISSNIKRSYTLYSPLGSNEFMLTEDELKEKKRTGYFKEAHEI